MTGEKRMVPREVSYVKIGARIKKLRIEKGLTQAELSDMAGCSNNCYEMTFSIEKVNELLPVKLCRMPNGI